MGARYNIAKQRAVLSTTADLLTLIAPSTRALKIWRIKLVGADTASAANEVGVYRSTGGTTGAGAITPQPKSVGAAAAATIVWTAWTAQPTLGASVERLAVNANGGVDVFNAAPGNEIDVPPSGQISVRSISGTSNVVMEFDIEEVG